MLILLLLTILVLVAALSHWRGRSFLFSTLFSVPHAKHAVKIEADVAVPMGDGTRLFADIYIPKGASDPPTILMRTPYGKTTPSTKPFAQALAHRGYIVVAQDVRGTGKSEGEFTPLLHERRDGAETLEWLRRQSWFDGRLGLFGLSYIGFTANAIAVDNPPEVKAVFAPVTTRGFYDVYYETGGFNLDAALGWAVIVHRQKSEAQTGPTILQRLLSRGAHPDPVPYDALPILEADVAATGAVVDFYRTFVTQTDRDDAYWTESSLSEADIAGIKAPVYLASGWYDALLPRVLDDYQALKVAGRNPRLVIGDGPHIDVAALLRYLKHAITWFDHHLYVEDLNMPDAPVRIWRMGDKAWLDYPAWPPATKRQEYFLHADGGLIADTRPTLNGKSTSYTFDPADPTPAVGGPLLASTKPVVDNAALEARSDTVVFTTEPFAEGVDIIGAPSVVLFVDADRPTLDLFVRLSRVDKNGVSRNITDGVHRFYREGESADLIEATVDLSPTAIRLKPGEKLRLLVASGAHPRIARNLGEGDLAAQARATVMHQASIRIYHNADNPSRLEIPIPATSQ